MEKKGVKSCDLCGSRDFSVLIVLEMDLMEISIMLHVGLVLLLLWMLSQFNLCHPLPYFLSLIYLYLAIHSSSAENKK
ncbi:hypothetical protein ES319_D01G039200v1 [Gossypium barbadense]|uniref:Uncharacterized protein n=1 Tax=Gossypium barbadense TaxID=3634 RepID=A0A5J5SK20_GOSBA|nr:hypothetical protein ES319_D01G039200v1 [Gossypium barbadense]